ncbi:MAG TPA: hypothetical protein VFG07_04270, partial [Thermoplasmata archaeon]|nr:hypothetical protein [Thermoplasmata archaeon]
FSWQVLMGIAYDVTLSGDGVAVNQRRIFIPGKMVRPPVLVKWGEMRHVSVKMGSVSIQTDNVWTWMNLTYNQARAILTDPRCPLHRKIPPEVARVLGIPASSSGP